MCGEEGQHFISAKNIDFAFMNGYNCIVLLDRKTGIETDLTSVEEYNFTAARSDDGGRFVLKLSKEEDCSATSTEENLVFGNTLNGVNIIFESKTAYPAYVSISNMIGQSVADGKQIPSIGTYFLSTSTLSPGIYIVNVTVNEKSYSHKLVVR